ncbi:MAG: hypothetical protein IPP63_15270 [Chloracidobacterium sp.]|nr:hypothetical protein [Chloracidobacterium sp.]
MREFVVVLLVILILLGITAFKYRRQIAMVIGFGKMLRDARSDSETGSAQGRTPERLGTRQLQRCGTWVPQIRRSSFDAKSVILFRRTASNGNSAD